MQKKRPGGRASPVLGLLSVVALGGCDLLGPTCATYADPGIVVSLVDSLDGNPVSAPSEVIASEGAYADTVHGPWEPFDSAWAANLAFERPGTYRVTATAEGYRPWVKDGVRVTEGRCHVRTVTLEALMQPMTGRE